MEINGKKVVVIGGASGWSGERRTAGRTWRGCRGARPRGLRRQGRCRGFGGTFYPVDVTDFTGTEETLQAAVDKLGGLHVIITTAGGGIAKRTLTKSVPTTSNPSNPSSISTSSPPSTSAAWRPRTWPRTTRGRRARCDHQHRLHRGVRGPDRPGRLHRREGGNRGMCLTMARDWVGGHPGAGDRTEPVRYGVDQGHSGRVRLGADQGRGLPKRLGRPEEYARLVQAIVEIPMLNGQCLRLDAGHGSRPSRQTPGGPFPQ